MSDPALVSPLESGLTLADPSKDREQLGWEPTVSFEEMAEKMVTAQMLRLKKGDQFKLSLLFLTLIRLYFTHIRVNMLAKVVMAGVGFEVGIVFKASNPVGIPQAKQR